MNLTEGNLKRTLFKMALPMLAGTFAMVSYNLADTWFVSQLGKIPLAAMGFTFPVVMLFGAIFSGLGMGITSLVAHAVGGKDKQLASRYTTHGFIFVLTITVVFTLVGLWKLDDIFKLLGADEKVLPLVTEYMTVWFAGSIFTTFPIIGNSILIACGDSKSASRMMMLGTMLNLILDPIFIFGFAGIPALGIKGAALATIFAKMAASGFMLHLLIRKHKLLRKLSAIVGSWTDSFKSIVRLGVPSIGSMLLMPISGSIMVRIIGEFGTEAVAATGAAARIEMFAFVIPMALGISLSPFVGQNFGAKKFSRISETIKVSSIFAMGYGLVVAAIFFLAAPFLASVFTTDEKVFKFLVSYIHIISFGYGMMEVHRYAGTILQGLHKPGYSMMLNILRIIFLLIPLSLLGARLGGINGVFFARLITDVLSGSLGLILVIRVVRKMREQNERTKAQPGRAILES